MFVLALKRLYEIENSRSHKLLGVWSRSGNKRQVVLKQSSIGIKYKSILQN